jgi:hypothetical protein
MVDGLFVPLNVTLDHKRLHGDVAPVQGSQLGREGSDDARVNPSAVHQTGNLDASSVGEIGYEVVIEHVAVDAKERASLLGMNDEGTVLV